MDEAREYAERLAAWTWAAETLGREITREELKGRVEVTESVPVEHLKAAIKVAMQESERDFLPSPGLVCKIANRFRPRQLDEAELFSLLAARERKAIEEERKCLEAAGDGKPARIVDDSMNSMSRNKTPSRRAPEPVEPSRRRRRSADEARADLHEAEQVMQEVRKRNESRNSPGERPPR